MKRYTILFCLLLFIQIANAQWRSKVDERFELTSSVFALAGVPAYCQCAIPSYWEDIKKELAPYEMTEAINFVRELHQLHSISYDAVSTTAEMLDIKAGEIRLQQQYDSINISKIDSRWNNELFAKYIRMLNVFYNQSNYHQFFEKHRAQFEIAEKRMDSLLKNTVTKWFESFYGKQLNERTNIYISLCNGPNNYALQNGVLIGLGADEQGLPSPDSEGTLAMLIHELSHHFTNPIFDRHWAEMELAANKMYPYVKDMTALIGYGSTQTVFGEWMNNLFMLMYMRETGIHPGVIRATVKSLTEGGFIWMQRSVEFMDNFYAHRDRYPHIDDFMPQLIAFIDYTADHFTEVIDEYEHRCPVITNVYPAIGSDISGFKEIIVTFSESMNGSFGFYGTGFDDESVVQLPFDPDNVYWSKDKRSVTIPLLTNEIQENRVYGVQLFPRAFTSENYFWLDDRCKNIHFNTGYK